MAAIDPDQKFPFPEFTIAMGFFLLLTVEQIISDVRHRRLKPPAWLSQVPSLNNVIVPSPPGPSSIYETDDDHSTLIDTENVSTSVPAPSDEGTQNNNEQQSGPSSQSSQEEADSYHSMRIVAMIIALSVHSTFEGIAIGVQTTQDDVLQVKNKQRDVF